MKKKVLITGSSGMLGIDLVLLFSHDYDVIATDIVKSKSPDTKSKNFIRCDITDRKGTINTIKTSKADIVIHAAAWTDVDGCELDKENAMKINAEGTHNVALGCKETKAVMFYVGSDFVFDGAKTAPYREDDGTNPLNTYGLSKLKGEEAIRKELERYFIIRTSWLFGKHGRNFVDIVLDKAERKKELRIVMDQFGSPTYTKDLSKAIQNLVQLSLENKGLGGIYHFSDSGSCSWFKYAEEIIKIAGKINAKLLPITTRELERPAVRPGMSILNTDKYSQLCNERPRSWQSALRHYLVHEQGVNATDVRNFKK